jgi:hypothetical protein
LFRKPDERFAGQGLPGGVAASSHAPALPAAMNEAGNEARRGELRVTDTASDARGVVASTQDRFAEATRYILDG